MNEKEKQFAVENGIYIPDMGYTYPEAPDEPFLKPKKIRSVDIENSFNYPDKSAKAQFKSFITFAFVHTLVSFISWIRFGLKIEGRENLRENKELLKNGAMTICNHVHRWDYIFVLIATKKWREWFPAKASNLETKDAGKILAAGGIPIPKTVAAIRKFYAAFDSLVAKKEWIHSFPESCRWDYYAPIRPFKLGTFKMARHFGYPILPLAISFRKPTGIRKFFIKHPLVTIRIGKPIPLENNDELSPKEFCKLLRDKAHKEVCALAGIKKNCWSSEEN